MGPSASEDAIIGRSCRARLSSLFLSRHEARLSAMGGIVAPAGTRRPWPLLAPPFDGAGSSSARTSAGTGTMSCDAGLVLAAGATIR